MGRLQSHVLNLSTAPPPCGNIGTGSKLASFAFDHTNALRCAQWRGCLRLYRVPAHLAEGGGVVGDRRAGEAAVATGSVFR